MQTVSEEQVTKLIFEATLAANVRCGLNFLAWPACGLQSDNVMFQQF
jgi:hypothetical protein